MRSRVMCAILFLGGIAFPLHAQEDRGWNFSGRFSGGSSSPGLVLKADPSVGYTFNRNFETFAGFPFYFVNESSTAAPATTAATSNGFVSGIGNAYIGFRVGVENPAVDYTSSLVLAAPTGEKDKGFSTGRVTADWNNNFHRRFSSIAPYANIGIANTVSDTAFFVRPFSSLGLVGHFDGGATVSLSPLISVGASAYAVKASGQQRVISKVIKRQSGKSLSAKGRVFETSGETVGSADIADDHGFSAWFGVNPQSNVDLQIGYTRSVAYDLNTLFFGVGFRIGK